MSEDMEIDDFAVDDEDDDEEEALPSGRRDDDIDEDDEEERETASDSHTHTSASAAGSNNPNQSHHEDDNSSGEGSEKARMLRLLSLLYRRVVFAEFRRPVIAAYPALSSSYLDAIADPMDLGTLYVHVLQDVVRDCETLREKLQLIAVNALTFNASNPSFVAIARHFDDTAEALFEALFVRPYRTEKTPSLLRARDLVIMSEDNNNNDNNKAMLSSLLREKARERLTQLQSIPLSVCELSELREMLRDLLRRREEEIRRNTHTNNDMETEGEEDAVCVALSACVSAVNESLTRTESVTHSAGETLQVPTTPQYTLSLLAPLLRALSEEREPQQAEAEKKAESALLQAFSPSLRPRFSTLSFLSVCEREVSLFAALVRERSLRGESCSAFWCLPHREKLVWTQLGKDSKGRNPWWPCLVLLSHYPPVSLPAHVMRKNVERLPSAVIKDLLKLRPRLMANTTTPNGECIDAPMAVENTTSVSEKEDVDKHAKASGPVLSAYFDPLTVMTEQEKEQEKEREKARRKSSKPAQPVPLSFAVPENYLLLEYFGKHDLGWKRADQTLPIDGVGANYPGTGSKIANNDVLAEFEAALLAMQERERLRGEPTQNERDLASMPELEALQKSVYVPPHLVVQRARRAQEREREREREQEKARESGRAKNPKAKKSDVVDREGNILTEVPGPSRVTVEDLERLDSDIVRFLEREREKRKDKSSSLSGLCVSRCPRFTQVETDVVAEGFHSKFGLNIRRNALARIRAVVHWLAGAQPLPTTRLTAEDGPSWPLPSSRNKGEVGEDYGSEHEVDTENEDERERDLALTAVRPAKRTPKPSKRYAQHQRDEEREREPEEKALRIDFLDRGCSRYSLGQGLFHRRRVSRQDAIFHRESASVKERLRLLRRESAQIDEQIDALQREMRLFSQGLLVNGAEEERTTKSTGGSKTAAHAAIKSPSILSVPSSCSLQSLVLPAKLRESLPGKVGLIAALQVKREREMLGDSSNSANVHEESTAKRIRTGDGL